MSFLTTYQVRELLREGKDKYMIAMNLSTAQHPVTNLVEKATQKVVGRVRKTTLNGIDHEFKNTIRYYEFK